jgi:hypothetical protein
VVSLVIVFSWIPLLLLLACGSSISCRNPDGAAAPAAAAAWYTLLLLGCTGCRQQLTAVNSCSCSSLPRASCQTSLLLLLLLLLSMICSFSTPSPYLQSQSVKLAF